MKRHHYRITLDVEADLAGFEDVLELVDVGRAEMRQVDGVETTLHAIERLPAKAVQ